MDSQGLDCVGRLTTLLQESSYWRQKKSTKLSFTQFAADSAERLPCSGSTRGCGRAGQCGRDRCQTAHRLGKCTRLFLSCYANRRKTIFSMCFLSSNIRARPSFTWRYSSPRDKVPSLYVHIVIPVPTGERILKGSIPDYCKSGPRISSGICK